MTWQEFLDSDLSFQDYLNEQVQTALRDLQPQVDEALNYMKERTAEAERGTAECEFERLVRENAVFGGVLPKAVPYIAASARELFELRENALVVRNGETDPGDPLTPLTFDVWLKGLRGDMEFLFAKE